MKEKTDRRVQRTRKLLREAIIEMILRKGYIDLTIEEITEQANLGRTTFYLHYHDKKELLRDALEEIMNELFAEIYSAENLKKWEEQGEDPRRLVFAYAAENSRIRHLLLDDEVSGIVVGHFQTHLADILEKLTEGWQKKLGVSPNIPNPVSANYISGALTSLLVWWLKQEVPCPVDEIYGCYHEMMVKGGAWAIGIV